MQDKNILREQYKLIADFMGYSYIPRNEVGKGTRAGWYRSRQHLNENNELIFAKSDTHLVDKTLDLNFKHGWVELMRVVEKIENIESNKYGGFDVNITRDSCTIFARNKSKQDSYSKTYFSINDKLKATYESVLLFINWYNTTLKNDR